MTAQLCQAGQTVGGGVAGLGGSIAGFGAQAVLGSFSEWVASGAAWLLRQVGQVVTDSTSPDLSASWFRTHLRVMERIAAFAVLPLLLVSVLQGLVRQDLASLVRSVLLRLPVALAFTAVALEVVQLSLSAVDALSSTVAASAGVDSQSFMAKVATALALPGVAPGSPGAPAFVDFLAAVVVALGAFLLWVEMLIRSAAVYAAVLFLPLALAGLVWPATLSWSRRLAEILAALVLSKFVVVSVLSLAVGALSGEGSAAGFGGVMAGAALLLLAAFAPFSLLKLVPVAEAGAIAHMEGLSRRATHGGPVRSAAEAALSSVATAVETARASTPDSADLIPLADGTPEPPGLSWSGDGRTGGDTGGDTGRDSNGPPGSGDRDPGAPSPGGPRPGVDIPPDDVAPPGGVRGTGDPPAPPRSGAPASPAAVALAGGAGGARRDDSG